MALKTILNTQEDFTGEFPAGYAKSGLWRFNESTMDDDGCVSDSSGCGRSMEIVNWSGTTAAILGGQKGNYVRINISSPSTEQTYLKVENDGTFFSDLGERIICGGWMKPTTYSVGNTYTPIFNTRYGPGQPIFYLSFIRGKPRLMLYNSSGTLILDQSTSPTITLVNGGVYFLAAVIEPDNKQAWYVLGDRDSGECWVSDVMTWTGDLNRSCTADIIMEMHADSYWYAGGFDDWFLDKDSELTAEDLQNYFYASLCANGGDTTGDVDAIFESGSVTLRATSGVYPVEGTLYTAAMSCDLSGTGRVQISYEITSGVTAVTDIQTSTSDDLLEWSDWSGLDFGGRLVSPNRAYIRFRMMLTTSDTSVTPKVTAIRLYDVPKSAYNKLGYACPVVLDENDAWEAVLENAYGVIVTSEINGEDCLNFSLPFTDEKRQYLDNEKSVQIVEDVYRIRTITDTRDTSGKLITQVYAEAEFYDLAYSVRKAEKEFDAAT